MSPFATVNPDEYHPFEFETEIVHHNLGTYRYTVVFLDPELHEHLPLKKYPRLRASGEVRDIPFDGAWQPVRGRWYLMLSKQLMRGGEFEVGDVVTVRFRVEDPDSIDMPPELVRALQSSKPLQSAWDALTPGKRRGLAYGIANAKTQPTRSKRLRAVLEQLRQS
ncbi:MAG: YdeI/OmpD-associated family protein [Planctomycetota bacterium]